MIDSHVAENQKRRAYFDDNMQKTKDRRVAIDTLCCSSLHDNRSMDIPEFINIGGLLSSFRFSSRRAELRGVLC